MKTYPNGIEMALYQLGFAPLNNWLFDLLFTCIAKILTELAPLRIRSMTGKQTHQAIIDASLLLSALITVATLVAATYKLFELAWAITRMLMPV